MRMITADYIFPISSPPVKGGVIVLDETGVIVDMTEGKDEIGDLENFHGILCPGFVNAHCHLELSHLKGKIPQKKGLLDFIEPLMTLRIADESVIAEAMAAAENEMVEHGIVAVADIVNTPASFDMKQKSRMKYHTFVEVLNLLPRRAESVFQNGIELLRHAESKQLSCSVTPHAPYSVSMELLRLICAKAKENNKPLSIHIQENEQENPLFVKKGGAFGLFYEKIGVGLGFFKPTGKSSVQSIIGEFPSSVKTLFVHNTFTPAEDLDISIKHFQSGMLYHCFCPNANMYIEGRIPNMNMFISKGAKMVIGTDSLASNHKLSVLEELKTIKKFFPQIPLQLMLQWATINGAEFMGLEKELGTLEKGKQPGINLIEEVDLENMLLTETSSVRRIA